MTRRAITLVVLLSTGCGVTLRAGRPETTPEDALRVRESASDRCVHGTPGPDSPYREPLPGPVEDPELVPHLARFDPSVRRTAQAAGLEPLLARVLRERAARVDGAPSAAELSMRQELAERIDSLETQLTAMEFECDCVRALMYDVEQQYEEAETDRQLTITFVSLGVAAATSLAAGVWDLANSHTTDPAVEDGPLVVGIAGAVATTALGLAILPQPREIVYVHEHNILTPIVRGEDPDLVYPMFVFRMLTMPRHDDSPSPRDLLVASWREDLDDAVGDDRREVADRIVYGEGGVYDPGLLAVHQDLLQELGATLDSFAREIDELARAIAVALEEDFVRDADAL